MSKKLVKAILQECVEHQDRTIAGGLVGDDNDRKAAYKDLDRYKKARDWAYKNL